MMLQSEAPLCDLNSSRPEGVISYLSRSLLCLLPRFLPLIDHSAGTKQRRRFIASRNVGLVVTVSSLALIVVKLGLPSFDQ